MDISELSGLPDGTVELLESTGIEELYPPQVDAVEAGITDGVNLVVSVPTASGKTLIAALAMLAAIERGGKALYIVPLRALASEKRAEFEQFESLGIDVGVSTGSYESSDEWLASKDIIVATSEKVDSLLRNDASWIDSLTCVVADEVHLVDDAHRGPTLEVTLAKLQVTLNPQLVALSATIGNADLVADWLDASLIESTWRPIELKRGIQFGNAINFEDGTTQELEVKDKPTAALVRDALTDEGSSLVFVNSRRNAEAAARRLAEVTDEFLDADTREILEELAGQIRRGNDTETSKDLARSVAAGAAFHHAGLTQEHRSIIESAFRDRHIKVICATPTLAAGVNTPSRRVIVRDWRRYDGGIGGMKPLSTLEVHQMFGRAGRPGLDPYGEALLLASSHDELEELFDRYVYAEPEAIRSKLAAEPALRTHVLATIATGYARTREGLLSFLDETLYAVQTTEPGRLEAVADAVIEYLIANDFLLRDGSSLEATSIGHTVSRLYLDPMSAAEIIDGLRHAEEPTSLGLYHLVARTPDMYELYLRSGDREQYTETAYQREDELLGRAPSEFDDAWEDWLSALKTALLLEDWTNEEDEDRLTERFGVGPGDIHGKVETAEWLLNAAERLADELDFGCGSAIRSARLRVDHGVKEELLELVGITQVGRKRARRLYEAGIEAPVDLREEDKSTILRALSGRRQTAETIMRNAGRPDPSLDGVSTEQTSASTEDEQTTPAVRATSTEEDNGEQTGLGDF